MHISKNVLVVAILMTLSLFSPVTAMATPTDGTITGGLLYGYVKMLQVKHDTSMIVQVSDTIDGPLKKVCGTINFYNMASGIANRKEALSTMTAAFLAGRRVMIESELIGTTCYLKTVMLQAGY